MRAKPTILAACLDCGKALTGHGKGERCLSCAAKERWTRRRVKYPPQGAQPTVVLECAQCGASVRRWPSQVGRWSAVFCSPRCQTEGRTQPLLERFWQKIDKNGPIPPYRPDLGPCWLWTDRLLRGGYGTIAESSASGATLLAHRYSYELRYGTIPEGLQIDHLCRVRHCVNPAHLEAVTQEVNLKRGMSPSMVKWRKRRGLE